MHGVLNGIDNKVQGLGKLINSKIRLKSLNL